MKEITIEELKAMRDREGLILQGCGGDLSEWEEGITHLLAERGIVKEGDSFKNVVSFTHGGIHCILFPFEGTEIDMGRLAMWRLESHGAFAGTWLSDFLANRFGVDINGGMQGREKPDCPLIGADGNIFSLLGIAGRTLRDSGMEAEAKEMGERVCDSGSYDSALAIIGEYVNITSADESGGEDETECMELA